MIRTLPLALLVTLLAIEEPTATEFRLVSTIRADSESRGVSLPAVLFSPDGKLFVARRIGARGQRQSNTILITVHSKEGAELARGVFEAPPAKLPRVIDSFLLTRDGRFIFYAEHHAPIVAMIVDAQTLRLVSRSTRLPKLEDSPWDMAVGGDTNYIVLATVRFRGRGKGYDTLVHEFSPENLNEARSECVIENPGNSAYAHLTADGRAIWFSVVGTEPPNGPNGIVEFDLRSRSRKVVIALSSSEAMDVRDIYHVGGQTLILKQNGPNQGSVETYDGTLRKNGSKFDCSPTQFRASQDGKLLAFECESVDRRAIDVGGGQALARFVIVVEATTGRILGKISISREWLHETSGPDPLSAGPVAAAYHDKGQAVVVVPTVGGAVEIYRSSW